MSARVASLATAALIALASCTDDGADPPAPRTPAKAENKPEPPPEVPEPPPEPEPQPDKPEPIEIGHVSTANALVLHHLYWMDPQYLLGAPHTLVVGGTVRQLAKMKPSNTRMRGKRWIVEARIEVEKTFKGTAPEFVVAELADDLAVDDKVIVFARAHEGELGLVEAKGSNARLGMVVQSWDDPIVGVLTDTLAGTADLQDAAVADAWRAFGEPAVACAKAGTPVERCE